MLLGFGREYVLLSPTSRKLRNEVDVVLMAFKALMVEAAALTEYDRAVSILSCLEYVGYQKWVVLSNDYSTKSKQARRLIVRKIGFPAKRRLFSPIYADLLALSLLPNSFTL